MPGWTGGEIYVGTIIGGCAAFNAECDGTESRAPKQVSCTGTQEDISRDCGGAGVRTILGIGMLRIVGPSGSSDTLPGLDRTTMGSGRGSCGLSEGLRVPMEEELESSVGVGVGEYAIT